MNKQSEPTILNRREGLAKSLEYAAEAIRRDLPAAGTTPLTDAAAKAARDPALAPADRRLFDALLSHADPAGRAMARLEKVAAAALMTSGSALAGLDRLAKAGYIASHLRGRTLHATIVMRPTQKSK